MITSLNEWRQYKKLNESEYYSATTLLKNELNKRKNKIGYFEIVLPGEGGTDSNDIIYIGRNPQSEGGTTEDERLNIVIDDSNFTYSIRKGEQHISTETDPEKVVDIIINNNHKGHNRYSDQ